MPVGPEVTKVIDEDWLHNAVVTIDTKLKNSNWVSEHRIESIDGKTQCWRFLLGRSGASTWTIAELAKVYERAGWTEVITEVVEESGRPAIVSVLLKYSENLYYEKLCVGAGEAHKMNSQSRDKTLTQEAMQNGTTNPK